MIDLSILDLKIFINLTEEDKNILVNSSKIIQENDTLLSGKIRILEYNHNIYIQEKTDKMDYIVRKVNNIDSAKKIVQDRLDTYDRMWDGCGCRIDYSKDTNI